MLTKIRTTFKVQKLVEVEDAKKKQTHHSKANIIFQLRSEAKILSIHYNIGWTLREYTFFFLKKFFFFNRK